MSLSPTKARGPPSIAESVAAAKHGANPLTYGKSQGGASKIVVTSPPWAKDEPESPELDSFQPGSERSPRPSGTSTTQVPSIISERPSISTESFGGHHRWNFALPRPRPKLKRHRSSDSSSSGSTKGGTVREKRPQLAPSRSSRSRWPNPRRRNSPEISQNPQFQTTDSSPFVASRSETLRLELPLPQPKAPFTLSHNKTPGWDSPWTPRVPEQAYANIGDLNANAETGVPSGWRIQQDLERAKEVVEREGEHDGERLTPWRVRKKKIRSFLLYNNYIPLVSRVINLTFTTVVLALAIRIRVIEQEHHLRGAVGSSPVLAIIFAPPALVHVMVAIYLDSFGRPLGLWRTSAKLAHTLSEVVFICAWSAELALCFDNYFTSPLNCAPHSTVQWYSELAPMPNPLGNNVTGDLEEDAHKLCASQLDLIGVVMVALIVYVVNLVISLFRIFEKVKVHQGWGYRR